MRPREVLDNARASGFTTRAGRRRRPLTCHNCDPRKGRTPMASARDDQTRLTRRTLLETAAGALALGMPAIIRAQPDAIRVGHITPRTGFLGQLGEYGLNAAQMAVDETNTAGGVLGRKVELIAEDSVNPGVAVTKVQKL